MADLFSVLTRGHKEVSHEGGAVYGVTDRVALRRFLIVGSFGSFYVDPKWDAKRWKDRVEKIVTHDPHMALIEVQEVAEKRLAQRRDPSLFVLARLMMPDMPLDVRRSAGEFLTTAAPTGTDLLHFMQYRYGATRTSNRTMRNAVRRWFDARDAGDLALQAIKYDQRDGWTMRDVLRLVRPGKTGREAPTKDKVLDWMAHPEKRLTMPHASYDLVADEPGTMDAARLMAGYSEIRMPSVTEGDAARIILNRRLPREAVPADFLKSKAVWAALKEDMPAHAFIRSLGKLGSMDLLDENDVRRVERAGDKLHPFAILLAKAVYDTGRGVKGDLRWNVNRSIDGALEVAFHRAFGTLEVDEREMPLIALDVSGSMAGGGEVIQPIVAEAAMAMILAKQYPNARFVAFADATGSTDVRRSFTGVRSGISPINIHGQNFRQVLQNISALSFAMTWTDINLPFEEAFLFPDVTSVIVMTDNETRNKVQATEVIRRIEKDRPEFRSAVVAFAANEISILDPNDPRQADFCGTDASLPRLLTMFLAGEMD